MKKSILTAVLLFLTVLVTQAREISVSGVVTSATDNEPLIGASVLCPSANVAVSTDLDGKFSFKAPEGADVNITYIGYKPVTMKAAPSMNVVMEENNEVLNELVVVGYQTIRKADLTGAVSVMDMKDPISENSGNILNSMAGKLPGVNVIPDAAPGGTGSIRVRGMSTANSSNDPSTSLTECPPTTSTASTPPTSSRCRC